MVHNTHSICSLTMPASGDSRINILCSNAVISHSVLGYLLHYHFAKSHREFEGRATTG